MKRLLLGGNIVTETEVIRDGYLIINQEKIEEIGYGQPSNPSNIDEAVELDKGDYIFPGFIDIHIHGAAGADTMDATPKALETMAETLPKEGTTSFLATTITDEEDRISEALKNASEFKKTDSIGAEMLGVHLEGPFINKKHAGAQPLSCIGPASVDQFKKWQETAEGLIRVVTLAPEEDQDHQLIQYLNDTGVIPSIGHSHATYEEVKQAAENGLKHATHLFNAMRPMHHREPGVVGAVFLSEDLMAEIIFDRIHVAQEMVELAYKNIGSDRMILITDSMRGKCLQNGTYDLGGQHVHLKDGEARLEDGTLAGSVLKMNEAVKNMSQLGVSPLDLMKMSSWNAAKSLGVDDRKGSIAAGKDADLVIMDKDFNIKQTYCRGTAY
ncbi:N-acetylglucosamine-6-phosphate deacetylase [Halobacillus yeomjeoni]|uniref:N-acetylglucosamine-6-phosphate deacetylase n=1 Tax=Halobacillus yeomjeoni TaxID=311194 RepID=UPI001CD65407|nr:N-acetylglucosamine-6-phosphate deacetylase [Halobacillus yeomjeoni]MCA0985144.1 N-acetylglucosamine-6-phosphate deacetylase [Halobacillus yeomjeoni]